MPINRKVAKTQRVGAGRKPKQWTPATKLVARQIARVRDSYGSGNKFRAVAGRTALDWCAPPDESVKGAWDAVTSPELPGLLEFAARTGRALEWLLTGDGPEMRGEVWKRADLSEAFAAHVIGEVARAFGAPSHTVGVRDRAAVLPHAVRLVVDEVRSARVRVEPLKCISAAVDMLRTVAMVSDQEAASAMTDVIKDRIADISGRLSPLEFLGDFPTPTTALDRAQAKAFRAWAVRNGFDADATPGTIGMHMLISDPRKKHRTR